MGLWTTALYELESTDFSEIKHKVVAFLLIYSGGGSLPPINGDFMAQLSLKERSVKPIILRYGGETYEVVWGQPIELPLHYAINVLGSKDINIELTEDDRESLHSLSDYKRLQLVPHYDVKDEDDGKAIATKLIPKKRNYIKKPAAKKKAAPKKAAPKKKAEPKKEKPKKETPKKEVEKDEPLPQLKEEKVEK